MTLPRPLRVIRKRYRILTKSSKLSPPKKKNTPQKKANKTAVPMSPSDILEAFLSLNPKTFLVSSKASLNPEVAVYFEGATNNLYQIQQWVLPFMELKKRHSILILARHKPIYDWVNTHTDIPVIYLRTIDDLQTFYDTNPDIKCILYVNHAFKNFQSLINNNALHVHINHGESDKTSTTTNQVKAYDRVFLVANAALQKYTRNLIDYDPKKFVMVGRPQLDGVRKVERPDTGRKIILYAPTWEGTHHSMDFSSIERFGEQIMDSVLGKEEQEASPTFVLASPPNESSKYYLIYRPHPRTGSRDPKVKELNEKLKAFVNKHEFAHLDEESDSLSLCEMADFAIFDNSAVAVDYLKYDKPFMLSDLFENQEGTRNDKPIITKAAFCINDKTIQELRPHIKSELIEDTYKSQRNQVREEFIGNYEEGESTQKFIDEITKVINTRDHLVRERSLEGQSE